MKSLHCRVIIIAVIASLFTFGIPNVYADRFKDNGDGTITDNDTGLIWLKDAGCFSMQNWTEASNIADTLHSGQCGLADGSTAGDWCLPTLDEFMSVLDGSYVHPAVSDTAGTAQWSAGDPFTTIKSYWYWSGSEESSSEAWAVNVWESTTDLAEKVGIKYLWPIKVVPVSTHLAISKNGQGSGTVSSNPSGITCGSQCTADLIDTSVLLTVTADAGSLFSGWGGDCASCGNQTPCQINLSGGNMTCTASFDTAGGLPSAGRFTNNGNGTITDNNTGLVWLKDANCFSMKNWAEASSAADTLHSGQCGLTDASTAGDWHLPTKTEFLSVLDNAYSLPALSNTDGSGRWTEGDAFNDLRSYWYWSGTEDNSTEAEAVKPWDHTTATALKVGVKYVWPVKLVQTTTQLAINKSGQGGGSVLSTPSAILCGTNCNATFTGIATVLLTATADIGSTFDGWSGDCSSCGTQNSCQLDLSRTNMACTASFDTWGGQPPAPRFINNGDGTITDKLTGLVWLKDANCFNMKKWADAYSAANTLHTGQCGLTDGSTAGEWHLPTRDEFLSLLDDTYNLPAVCNTDCTGRWSEGDAFNHIRSYWYWSGTRSGSTDSWAIRPWNDEIQLSSTLGAKYIWPVKGSLSGSQSNFPWLMFIPATTGIGK